VNSSARARLAGLAVMCLAAFAVAGPPSADGVGAGTIVGKAAGTDSGTVDSVSIEGTTVTLDLVRTPAGEIELRDERVAVPALWVSKTEITWDLYDVYLYGLDKPDPEAEDADGVTRPSKPYVPPDRGLGHAGYATLGMTRDAASRFCAWLSVKTGDRYRLPTEAEWIYLAEAGETPADGGEPGGETIDAVAWHEGNSDWLPHEVGTKKPNAFGLHDMQGNVAEWVAAGGTPFAMGGSYLDPAGECTPRSRQEQTAMWNASDPQIPKSEWWLADCGFVGFRVVREIDDPASPESEHETE